MSRRIRGTDVTHGRGRLCHEHRQKHRRVPGMFGKAIETSRPQVQPRATTRMGVPIHGRRHRARRRRSRREMGKAEGDAGTRRPTGEVIPVDAALMMEATDEAEVAHPVEVDPRAVVAETETPQGMDREGIRMAPDAHRGRKTLFWSSYALWETCSGSKRSTSDSAGMVIERLGSRSTGTFRRSRPKGPRICWTSSTLSSLRSLERTRRPQNSGP